MATILVHHLVKRFGMKTVLNSLDFQVNQGEFVALMGPNGAGKTTFLRILSSLSKPNSGRVSIAGFIIPSQAAEVRYQLGVVSHQPMLYGEFTAEENLLFFGRLYGVKLLEQRISIVLGQVGLADQRKSLVKTFSRGMQQRLSIARAILHDPQVLLLDEPYTGLDQDACEMLDTVLRQDASTGRTVVMTSHDLTRAADLATRFDVLSHGKIRASVEKANLPADGIYSFYRQALKTGEITG
jgi:heme exporter protein A